MFVRYLAPLKNSIWWLLFSLLFLSANYYDIFTEEGSRMTRPKVTSYKNLYYSEYLTWRNMRKTVELSLNIICGGENDCTCFVYSLRTEQKSTGEFLLSITNNFLATSSVLKCNGLSWQVVSVPWLKDFKKSLVS